MYYEVVIGNKHLDIPSVVEINDQKFSNKNTYVWCSSKQVLMNRFVTDFEKHLRTTLGQDLVKLHPYSRSINIEVDTTFNYFQMRSLMAGFELDFDPCHRWTIFQAIGHYFQMTLPKQSEVHINESSKDILFAIVFEDGDKISNAFMNDHMDISTVVLLKHLK
jgi:hypothetical protein